MVPTIISDEMNFDNMKGYKKRELCANKLDLAIRLLNIVQAENKVKRDIVESLRKERNIYDSIFKELEKQIIKSEKELLHTLETNRQNDLVLCELDEYMNKTMNGAKVDFVKPFLGTIENAKSFYNQLNESRPLDPKSQLPVAEKENATHPRTNAQVKNPGKASTIKRTNFAKNVSSEQVSCENLLVNFETKVRCFQDYSKPNQIHILEELINEIQFETELSSHSDIKHYYDNIEEMIDCSYGEFRRLEDSLSELTRSGPTNNGLSEDSQDSQRIVNPKKSIFVVNENDPQNMLVINKLASLFNRTVLDDESTAIYNMVV
mgnify:FL=1